MTNETIKAISNTRKNHPVRDWWKEHRRQILRVILFPIWFAVWVWEHLVGWLDSREKWSEARAEEIFRYYIPRRAEWDEKDKAFYLFDNGMGWYLSMAKKYLKFKDRRFWAVHSSWCGGDLRRYLIEKFELEGFRKVVGNCNEGWTEIRFDLEEGR